MLVFTAYNRLMAMGTPVMEGTSGIAARYLLRETGNGEDDGV